MAWVERLYNHQSPAYRKSPLEAARRNKFLERVIFDCRQCEYKKQFSFYILLDNVILFACKYEKINLYIDLAHVIKMVYPVNYE